MDKISPEHHSFHFQWKKLTKRPSLNIPNGNFSDHLILLSQAQLYHLSLFQRSSNLQTFQPPRNQSWIPFWDRSVTSLQDMARD